MLAIIFCIAFLIGGGKTIIPTPNTQTIDDAKNKVSQAADLSKALPSEWERLTRILFIKDAVAKKQNNTTAIPLRSVPLTMQQAIIAVEDNRFYNHVGLDIEGIIRASLVNLQSGALVEGGSTITQQLVKNLFLTHERTMNRKLEEAVLALAIECRYTKEEILEMYLNNIYFGSNAYGIKQAAEIYFAKTPDKLTLSECALLAGLPNAPSLYSPYVNFTAAKERQAIVLNVMSKNGYIGPTLANEAKAEQIKLAK